MAGEISMNVFMIGGTGLIGSEAAAELIRRGHGVSSVALPPVPPGAPLPGEMKLEFGNYVDMADDEVRRRLSGAEGFVFAAGVDERVEGPAPIYDMFKKYNIMPLARWLRIAKECGVRHAVICGSYFCHFDRIWPEKALARWHPYIRSRRDQEDMALSSSCPTSSARSPAASPCGSSSWRASAPCGGPRCIPGAAPRWSR
jgi:dihydroflavonol-4-reductase